MFFTTNKQGYKSDHYVLALAMKQVVVHEVIYILITDT